MPHAKKPTGRTIPPAAKIERTEHAKAALSTFDDVKKEFTEMVRVFPLNDKYSDQFGKMFADYYEELGCDENAAHLVDEYILPDLLAGLLRIDIMEEDGVVCGFCIYQKDEPGNEWNFKDGWGDIREIYISADRRRKGLGRFLLYTAEMRLKEAGVQNIYALPDSDAVDFFAACGYELTDETCDELDCNVFSKTAENGCKNCKGANRGI